MANLEDLIDPEYGLQQDEWSLTRPRFGAEGQIEVIGWSGKERYHKIYIVTCSICSGDSELFGDGCFKSSKWNLSKGQIACGCAKNPLWNSFQISIRIHRKCAEKGYTFLGFLGNYMTVKSTRCLVNCELHGDWETCPDKIFQDRGCPACRMSKLKKTLSTLGNRQGRERGDDSDHIKTFVDTGGFAEGTTFTRSIERKTSQGRSTYWDVYCPECEQTASAFIGQLKEGYRACHCGPSRQREAYINFVKEAPNFLAIKFGVANQTGVRIKQQARACIYDVENFGVWEFETKKSCLAAERECKQTLECGVLTKEEMADGYTETTWAFNLEKIIAIYEKHGGKRIK